MWEKILGKEEEKGGGSGLRSPLLEVRRMPPGGHQEEPFTEVKRINGGKGENLGIGLGSFALWKGAHFRSPYWEEKETPVDSTGLAGGGRGSVSLGIGKRKTMEAGAQTEGICNYQAYRKRRFLEWNSQGPCCCGGKREGGLNGTCATKKRFCRRFLLSKGW